jgi:antitoxin component YwqK of YwqJK toxin-antitoxin module
MKAHFIHISFAFLFSCHEKQIPEYSILKSSKDISIRNDIIYHKDEKFNGLLFELHPSGSDTLLSERIKNGIHEGVSKKWYLNRKLMEYREYSLGRKNGRQLAFWENGKKRFEFMAKNDAYEGELKEWTLIGQLFHLAHYANGQEDGIQKMWYENGRIRANYVIRNGKRYGLLGTKNCKNVSDSIFNVN